MRENKVKPILPFSSINTRLEFLFWGGTHRSGLTLLEMYHDGGQYHSRSLTYITDLISPQTNAIPQYYNNVHAKNRALHAASYLSLF